MFIAVFGTNRKILKILNKIIVISAACKTIAGKCIVPEKQKPELVRPLLKTTTIAY
jgi:hypothetical protein